MCNICPNHPSTASLHHPPTPLSHLRKPSRPTIQSQDMWLHQSSTHRWLTYLSGSKSTSWVSQKWCLCAFNYNTHTHNTHVPDTLNRDKFC